MGRARGAREDLGGGWGVPALDTEGRWRGCRRTAYAAEEADGEGGGEDAADVVDEDVPEGVTGLAGVEEGHLMREEKSVCRSVRKGGCDCDNEHTPIDL